MPLSLRKQPLFSQYNMSSQQFNVIRKLNPHFLLASTLARLFGMIGEPLQRLVDIADVLA
jgi:hypothetical protein